MNKETSGDNIIFPYLPNCSRVILEKIAGERFILNFFPNKALNERYPPIRLFLINNPAPRLFLETFSLTESAELSKYLLYEALKLKVFLLI